MPKSIKANLAPESKIIFPGCGSPKNFSNLGPCTANSYPILRIRL